MLPLNDYQQPVELYLSCQSLRDASFFGKTNPRVRVYMHMLGEWTFIGQTERIADNLNPDFKTSILADFIFETRQPMRFEVFDIDENSQNTLIGTVETTLGEIIGSRKQIAILELSKENKSSGKIIIRGDKTGTSKYRIFWKWSGINLKNLGGCFGKSSPFLIFYKQKAEHWLPVKETESKNDNLNPSWLAFTVEDDKICGGNHAIPFRIECWDYQANQKHKLIGHAELTLDQIKNRQTAFPLTNSKNNGSAGILKLLNFTIEEAPPSFIDYIRGGEQLSAIVAIDFTYSNKVPEDPTSLHAKLPNGSLNEYQQAINSVCQLILNYDYDMVIPVFGFGAWLKYDTLPKGISHCFPCSGLLEQTHVVGVDGIMRVYQYALDHLELSMPTYLAPIITEAVKACEINVQNNVEIYSILLILTDGDLQDMDATTEALHKASRLPISVIIIGVGEEDFNHVEKFQTRFLVSSNGKIFQRNFVQFVPFKKFKNDPGLLAKHVLAGVPNQLVEYKMLIGKKPNPPFY